MSQISSPQFGDIILVQTRSKTSDLNRFGQNIIRLFPWWKQPSSIFCPSTYSHVIMMMGKATVIHSINMKESDVINPSFQIPGVHLSTLPYLKLHSDNYRKFKVFRHPQVRSNHECFDSMSKEAYSHCSKSYKSGISFDIINISDKRYSKLFCSELIAKIFEKGGVKEMPFKKPFKTLPIDIEYHVQKKPWVDVTSEYSEECIESIEQEINSGRSIYGMELLDLAQQGTVYPVDILEKYVDELGESVASMTKDMSLIVEQLQKLNQKNSNK